MELRRGYRQTEIGVIPEDWCVQPLGELGEALIGLTYKPTDVREHGTLVLRSSNIQNDALAFDDNVFVVCNIPSQLNVKVGDVLVCVRNGSRQLIGKTALLDDRAHGMTFGAFMAVFRSPSGKLVSYLFQSEILKRQIKEHLGATINQITNKSLRSFVVPLSPHPLERDAIAEALSDVDALLNGLERLIAKKRDLKQGAMQQLLTGQTRLPGFERQWEASSLASVIGALEAGVSVNSVEDDPRWSQEMFILKTSAVSDGRFLPGESKRIAPRDLSRARLNPLKDTIIISRMNTPELVGDCGYVDRDYPNLFVPDRLWMARSKENVRVSARWLSYVLSSAPVKKSVGAAATGTSGSMKNLSKQAFLATPILLPSFREQTAIASILSDMDAEIFALEQRRDKTRLLKLGMMQELLTGRIRLVLAEAVPA